MAPELVPLLLAAVKNGSYELQPAQAIEANIDGKMRKLFRFELPDRFLLTHLAMAINQSTESILPDCLYSFRKGRSNQSALLNLSKFITAQKRPLFVVRCDVKDYGESMHHDLLLEDFKKYCRPSPSLESLYRKICRFPFKSSDTILTNTLGLPTGSYLQVVFANLYLLTLDTKLQNIKNSMYLRFGDDLVFLSPSHDDFLNAKQLINETLVDRQLSLNVEKSKDLLLCHPQSASKNSIHHGLKVKSYFEYLGTRLTYNGKWQLTRQKQRRILSYVDRHLHTALALLPREASARERIEIMISVVKGLLCKPRYYSHTPLQDYLHYGTDESTLSELDRWIALSILKAAYGKGFKASLFQKVQYKTLRAWGLPSVLHLSRTHGL